MRRFSLDRAAGVFAASRAETGVIPKRRSARFFALIGLFVNYFDLLTFPVVSLSFPLILLIALETKTTISFGGLMREALLCCIGWVLAYACMWMLKWGSTFSCWGRTESPPSATKSPSGCPRAANPTPDILLRNIRIVTDKTAYRVILLAVLALLALFRRRPPRRPRALLLLPCLRPCCGRWRSPTTHPTTPVSPIYRNLCCAFRAFALPRATRPTEPLSP